MKDNLIFDIGMHVGQDTEFYLLKGYDVVALEANPILVQQNQEKFSSYIHSGRLTIINKGISSVSCDNIKFYINETDSAWSSFMEDIGTRCGEFRTIEVTTTTTDILIREFGCPQYMKIDIEGLDYEAIKSLKKCSLIPPYISAENGQANMLSLLQELGYKSFKFINEAPIEGSECKSHALSGERIEYKFPHGSSGEFGEDTAGEWITYEEVLEASNSYWSNPNRDEAADGWYDVHAKI